MSKLILFYLFVFKVISRIKKMKKIFIEFFLLVCYNFYRLNNWGLKNKGRNKNEENVYWNEFLAWNGTYN